MKTKKSTQTILNQRLLLLKKDQCVQFAWIQQKLLILHSSHADNCLDCAMLIKNEEQHCPVCRQDVSNIMKIIFS